MEKISQWYLVSCFRKAEDKVLNDLQKKLKAYGYIVTEENIDRFVESSLEKDVHFTIHKEEVTDQNGMTHVKKTVELTEEGKTKAYGFIDSTNKLHEEAPTSLVKPNIHINEIIESIRGLFIDQSKKVNLKLFKKLEKHVNEETKKEKIKEVNLFPGYIFINLVMLDQLWYLIRNTQKVTGFIGSSGHGAKPIPLQNSEIDRLLENFTKQVLNTSVTQDTSSGVVAPAIATVYTAEFAMGDFVQVVSGPFTGQSGKVVKFDDKKGKAAIEIEFLGRKTSIDLDFIDLKKN